VAIWLSRSWRELTLARYRKLAAQDSLSRQDLDSQIATVGQYRGAICA
jgi:multidrug efflux system membrane fusion protein